MFFSIIVYLLLISACFADRRAYDKCVIAKDGSRRVGEFRWNIAETDATLNHFELDMMAHIITASGSKDNVRCFFGIRVPPTGSGSSRVFPLTYHLNDGSSLSNHFTTEDGQTFSVNMPTARVHDNNNCVFYLKYPVSHERVQFSNIFSDGKLLSVFGHTTSALDRVSEFWGKADVRYGFTDWDLWKSTKTDSADSSIPTSEKDCLVVQVTTLHSETSNLSDL